VSGNVPGVMVKSAPETVAPLIVTGPVPTELSVTVCVTGVFTATLPKFTLATPTLSVGTGTFNWRAKLVLTMPALAVRLTVCAVETGDTLAVNCALVVFAWISAAVDTVTAALLLDKTTLKPAAGAGPLIVTVQRSVPVPPIDALLQEMPLSCGAPVPVSAITAVLLLEELLETVN
jgi:hypothetical protein